MNEEELRLTEEYLDATPEDFEIINHNSGTQAQTLIPAGFMEYNGEQIPWNVFLYMVGNDCLMTPQHRKFAGWAGLTETVEKYSPFLDKGTSLMMTTRKKGERK